MWAYGLYIFSYNFMKVFINFYVLIHSFNNLFQRADCGSGTLLCTGDIRVNKTGKKP